MARRKAPLSLRVTQTNHMLSSVALLNTEPLGDFPPAGNRKSTLEALPSTTAPRGSIFSTNTVSPQGAADQAVHSTNLTGMPVGCDEKGGVLSVSSSGGT